MLFIHQISIILICNDLFSKLTGLQILGQKLLVNLSILMLYDPPDSWNKHSNPHIYLAYLVVITLELFIFFRVFESVLLLMLYVLSIHI